MYPYARCEVMRGRGCMSPLILNLVTTWR